MMKKVLLFLMLTVATSFTFISCSKNDDGPATTTNDSPDPIIGTWHLYSANEDVMSECSQKSNRVFTATKFTGTFYKDESEECVVDKEETESDWENKGDGLYVLGDNENEIKITFSNEGKTLTAVVTYDDGRSDKLVYNKKD